MVKERKERRKRSTGSRADEGEITLVLEENEHAPDYQADGETGTREEHDFEGSIIDHYMNIISSSAASLNKDGTSIHPAFRNSVVFDAESGTWKKRTEQQTIPKPYTASVYNQTGFQDVHTVISQGGPSRTAAERAKAYRDLVGMENDDLEKIEEEYEPISWRVKQNRTEPS